MAKKVTRAHVTPKEWETIKTLQTLGLSPTQAAVVAKRANSTVGYIYESNSFEDFRTHNRERNKAGVTPQKKHITEAQPVEHDELIKQLARIADGIEKMVEAWQESPRKKKLF